MMIFHGNTSEEKSLPRRGILFVHGIVGNCHVFDFLMSDITQGYEVRFLTLAGHGGDAKDFSRASMSRWKAQVEEAVDEMSSCCDRIIGVGHSMGCLLLLGQALRGRLSALFLLNPPLRLRMPYRLCRNALMVAGGFIGDDPSAQAAASAYGVSIDLNLVHYYGWSARFLELYAEIRRMRHEPLHELRCPVQVFFAGRDEVVSPNSARYFRAIRDVHVAVLPASGHYYYTPDDKAVIVGDFRALISMPDNTC